MKYSLVRQVIKSGDLLAWRKKGVISKFIQHWTGSNYSHVGIAWIFRNRVFVLQDKEFVGIDLVSLSENLPCDYIQTNAEWTDEVENFAVQHLGQKYSYANAARAALGLPPKGTNKICSEYATDVLKLAKVLDEKHITLTPGQLVSTLIDLGKPLSKVTEEK